MELVVKGICRTGNQREPRKRRSKHLHDFKKRGGTEGLFGKRRVTSTPPQITDLEDWAVDINLGPKIYFPFSTSAALRPCEPCRRCQVCRSSRGAWGKMSLPLICLRSLKQSRKDDLTAVELGWDTGVPKVLLWCTVLRPWLNH